MLGFDNLTVSDHLKIHKERILSNLKGQHLLLDFRKKLMESYSTHFVQSYNIFITTLNILSKVSVLKSRNLKKKFMEHYWNSQVHVLCTSTHCVLNLYNVS